MSKNAVQPIVLVDDVARFKENKIVSFLLDFASNHGVSLNQICTMPFDRDDYQHLMQLIGYSVSGYGDLSTHDVKICADADAEVERLR